MYNKLDELVGDDVAPLAGSVDRNADNNVVKVVQDVAPLAGSVDRNPQLELVVQRVQGRSPRGERG